MQHRKRSLRLFFGIGLILVLVIFIPPLASGQDYPDKPITIYVGYTAGGGTDLTARALATGAEKLLGVPVLVENKPGAAGTVCASLLAAKKADGYTLAILDTGAISTKPLLLKVNYDPQKDFTPIIQYCESVTGLCVLSESSLKTIEDFIAYAKAHPGMTCSSTGVYTIHHLATDLFAHAKGLKIKNIHFGGSAEAITALLGKHCDFLMGPGSHIPYVQQGKFRMLMVLNTDKRDPDFPDVPTAKELGCEGMDPVGYVVIGPKGMSDKMVKKLEATFKKVTDGPDFQALLKKCYLPYSYKNGAQLVKDLPAAVEQYERTMKTLGMTVKKE